MVQSPLELDVDRALSRADRDWVWLRWEDRGGFHTIVGHSLDQGCIAMPDRCRPLPKG
jgi:hypothetical protein